MRLIITAIMLLTMGCATLPKSDPRVIAHAECRKHEWTYALIPDAGITHRRNMLKCMDVAGYALPMGRFGPANVNDASAYVSK